MYDIDHNGNVDISELREVIRAFHVVNQQVVDDAKIDAETQVRSLTYLLTCLLIKKSTF